MYTKFINREKEFNKIKELLNNKKETSCGSFLLLYSKSGIGKARLIEEYTKTYYPVSLKIHVEIPNSPNLIVSPYHYFNTLYNVFFENYNLNLDISVSGISFQLMFTQLHFEIKKINSYPKEISIKLKSLQHFLKRYKNPVIITIENVQAIDKESLDILKILLKDFSNLQIFMLYNISEQYTKGTMNSFFEYIQNFSITLNPISVSKLTYSHVLDALGYLNDKSFSDPILRKVYQKYDGNLDELIVSLAENNISKQGGYDLIDDDLSSNEKFIMYLLLFNMGELSLSSLTELLKNHKCYKNLLRFQKKLLDKLEEKHIIEVRNSRIIMNNSIISYLEKASFCEESYVALNIVKEKSWDELESGIGDFSALYKLTYIYSLLGDNQIIALFPYVKRCGSINRNIGEILNRIEKICTLKCKNPSIKESVILEIVGILYTIGEWNIAYQKLRTIFEPTNIQHEMYNLALKSVLNKEGLEYDVQNLIKKYKTYPRIELFCKYMYLYHIMQHGSSVVAKNYAKDILSNQAYRPYLEYYFVLKNYSVYLNNNEAIDALQECIRNFCLNDRNDLAIRTKITLAMRNANKGNLKLAHTILKTAEKENKYACRECYFLNNFAVLNILEKKFDDNVEMNLKNALIFSPTTYEQGIILSNLLIYYCETDCEEQAKNIANLLESSKYNIYKFEQYQHIIHYNLYYYYTLTNDSTNQLRHYIILKELYASCPYDLREYMDATLFKKLELPPNHRRYFYSHFPYRPDYIGYWQLEVPQF